MTDLLRVGIVGCGEAAQIIHLPALAQLPDRFRVTALCDVSHAVLNGVAERWNVAARHTDAADLIARADVDVVLIANPHVHHAEVAILAMNAGKHIMIEKPVCLTLEDADRLVEIQARTQVIAQVGYMRRYAPAFLEAVSLIPSRGEIRRARVHDVIGQNALIVGSTSHVFRGNDIPSDLLARGVQLHQEQITSAIGEVSPDVARAYLLLLALGSHDTSAMRELIGTPRGVLFAAQRWEGRFIAAALDYGSFVCEFAIGVDQIGRMDAYLEVDIGSKMIRVEYDTPYIRNLPARLVVTEPDAVVGLRHTTSFATRQDAFVLEWQVFHDNVTTRRVPKTSLIDAREDLALFGAIARAMH
jgi:predicted dehydrogenase